MDSQHGIPKQTTDNFKDFLSSALKPGTASVPAHATADILQDDFGEFSDFKSAPAASTTSSKPATLDLTSLYASSSSSSLEAQTLNADDVDSKPKINDRYALFMKLRNSSPTFVSTPSPNENDASAMLSTTEAPSLKSDDVFTVSGDKFMSGLIRSDSFSPNDDIDVTELPVQNIGYRKEQTSLPEFGSFYSSQPPPLTDGTTCDSQSVSSLELPNADKTSSSDSERVSLGKSSEASLDLKSFKVKWNSSGTGIYWNLKYKMYL